MHSWGSYFVHVPKVSHSRILYMKYTDYIERWDEITNIFSREAILIDRRRNQDC